MLTRHTFKKYLSILTPGIILFISVSFYGNQYFLRVSIQSLGPVLSKSLHMNALSLATIAASFYYAYMVTLFFSGALTDRYGTRITLTIAAFFVAFGCLLFSNVTSDAFFDISRICMGIGAAFAFVCVIKLAKHWFSPNSFSLINGLTQSVGCLGAIVGTTGLNIILSDNTWHSSMEVITGIAFLIALAAWLIVDDPPNIKAQLSAEKKKPFMKHFIEIQKKALINPHVWLHGLYLGFIFAIVGTFAALWSIPYYEVLYHTQSIIIDSMPACLFAGIAVGSLLFSYLNNLTKKPILLIRISAYFTLVLAIVALYTTLPMTVMAFLLFILGCALGATVLSFYVISFLVCNSYRAAAIAITSLLQMSCGALLLPIIGELLEVNYNHTHTNTLYFPTSDYHFAFLFIIASIVIACILSCFFSSPPIEL